MKVFKAKIGIKTKNVQVKEPEFLFKPLKIESGIFAETSHYAAITPSYLYSILLYGTQNGKIPGRNLLTIVDGYVKENIEKYIRIYIENKDSENAGHAIGTEINNFHKETMYSYNDIPNAQSTIKQKGFNNPFILTGSLAKALSYKVNEKGLFGGG